MNKIILLGRLTRDPEIRYTASQMAVANFTLAIDRQVKAGEEKKADFPRCKAFGKTAEVIERYAHKGKQIAIEGRLQTGSYQKDDGSTVYTTDVIVDRLTLLGGGSQQDGSQEPASDFIPDGFQQIDEDVPF